MICAFPSADYALLCSRSGPVLVHSSAGVGRTGTLIAFDTLANRIDNIGDDLLDAVDIFGTVFSLRQDRCFMVSILTNEN